MLPHLSTIIIGIIGITGITGIIIMPTCALTRLLRLP